MNISAMTPVICPLCWTVAIFDEPTTLGESRMCPCMDRKPITSPVAFVRLRLPEGYELTRKALPPIAEDK